jgi:hypothetical protein
LAGIIERLVAELSFQVNDKQLEKFNDKLESTKINFKKIGAAATVLTASITAVGRSFSQNAFNVAKISDRANIETKNYQNLAAALEIGGESARSLDSALVSLADISRDVSISAGLNPRGAAGLARLQINIRDLNGELKTSDRLLLDVANRIQKLPDALARLALSDLGIDDSLGQFIRNEGVEGLSQRIEESRASVRFFTESEIESAKQLNKQYELLKKNLSSLKDTVGSLVTPGLTKILEGLNAVTTNVRNAIDALRSLFTLLPDLFSFLNADFTKFASSVTDTLKNLVPDFIKSDSAPSERVLPDLINQRAPNLSDIKNIQNGNVSNVNNTSSSANSTITNNVSVNINTTESAQEVTNELEKIGVIANRNAFDNFNTAVIR